MSDFTKAELKLRIAAWLERAAHFELDAVHSMISPCRHPNSTHKGESHYCPTCKSYLEGWWCPKSPDHYCYYYSEEHVDGRIVQLNNGTQFQLPKDHDHKGESDDWCIFCNEPDERK